MKKILTILLIAIITMSCLSSCLSGNNQQNSNNDGNGKKEYKIAVVPKVTSSGWFQRMEEGVVAYNKEHGTNYYYGGPTEATDQVTYFEQLLAEDWDAICIVPFDTQSIAPLLERARNQGILVILHEADTMDPKYFDYDVEAFASADLGTHYGEYLVEHTGQEGVYIQFVGSLNSVSHNIWCDAADKYISENSNLVKIGRYETNDDMTVAYNKTKELLQAHPEITTIECSASTDIPGAARAIEELGLVGKVVLTGTSLVSISGEYIEKGTVGEFSLWDPAKSAQAMISLAEQVLEKGDSFDINNCSLTIPGYEELTVVNNVIYGNARVDINKDNMADYDF